MSSAVRGTSRVLAALLMAASVHAANPEAAKHAAPIFTFQSNFWVNLHHFVRAAARGVPAPGTLDPDERRAWDAALAKYRERYTNRDLLFDDGMVAIKDTLRKVPENAALPPIPAEPGLKEVLESIAPVYRRHWWPAHDTINRAWIASVQPLVERWGDGLADRIAASYGERWPAEPHPVDVSVQAGPVGAYTSRPPHTTIASTGVEGFEALEILFHEASHRWGKALADDIRASAVKANKDVPRNLWHAVLFHDDGEITRRVLEADGWGEYREYAEGRSIYRDFCGDGCRERIAAAWDPFLDGKRTRQEAIDALVASWPPGK